MFQKLKFNIRHWKNLEELFASCPGHDKLFARDPGLVALIPAFTKPGERLQYILLVIELGGSIEGTEN